MNFGIESLETICINWLASNLESVTYVQEIAECTSLKFRSPDAILPECIGDALLNNLNSRGYLTKLVISLFEPTVIRLSSVKISCGTCIGLDSLKILKRHKLKVVEIAGLDGELLSQCTAFFNDRAFDNLTELSLINSRIINSYNNVHLDEVPLSWDVKRWQKRRIYLPFWTPLCAKNNFTTGSPSDYLLKAKSSCSCMKLSIEIPKQVFLLPKSIISLNLSGTDILYDAQCISSVCGIGNLVKLDLSSCEKLDSITFLEVFKHSLKYLILYDTSIAHSGRIISTLLVLQKLRTLDINTGSPTKEPYINSLLVHPKFCPTLQELDISCHTTVEEESLLQFIASHPNVKFIGMIANRLTNDARLEAFLRNCQFSSVATYNDQLESLKRYSTRRKIFLNVVEHVGRCYGHYHIESPQMYQSLAENIILGLDNFRRDLQIRKTGITALSKLIKPTFPPRLLNIIAENTVDLLLDPDIDGKDIIVCGEVNFQITCFNMLMNLEAFSTTSYDKVDVIYNILFSPFLYNNPYYDERALQLCSILFNKMTQPEASTFIQYEIFQRLAKLLDTKVNDRPVISNNVKCIRTTLSVLWSLTDESPSACEMLLQITDLRTLIKYIATLPYQWKVQDKMFGIISNIAEVQKLRNDLICDDMLTILNEHLESNILLISVLVAFTLSNLILCQDNLWTKVKFAKKDIQMRLKEVVMQWEVPQYEIIKYRNFKAFVELLDSFDTPEVQLFALWLLKNITSVNRERYCKMLLQNDILNNIVKIQKQGRDQNLRLFAEQTVNIFLDYYKLTNKCLLVIKLEQLEFSVNDV